MNLYQVQFSRTAGLAGVVIAGYKYIDENGIVQEVVYDVQAKLLTSIHVEKCVGNNLCVNLKIL